MVELALEQVGVLMPAHVVSQAAVLVNGGNEVCPALSAQYALIMQQSGVGWQVSLIILELF